MQIPHLPALFALYLTTLNTRNFPALASLFSPIVTINYLGVPQTLPIADYEYGYQRLWESLGSIQMEAECVEVVGPNKVKAHLINKAAGLRNKVVYEYAKRVPQLPKGRKECGGEELGRYWQVGHRVEVIEPLSEGEKKKKYPKKNWPKCSKLKN